ncbi:similar to DNA polymerase III alpha chain [Aromatoleum aromaticum EbN1]|uniref:Error-prone DNA polymerase n=1 Tax=Aromatoleum aromaticum (strain DSM 19018 / LMG 30748 / EbN1) TaxID=76114 RepID=DNAE2_AROAE|nr:error-prone DNA polymerase [Aromatoleum aromaticum]Q5P4A4.1 RecName: Full=Error-prone DNA polymerase [Aromatoleum aromaticum EbN1]CAI07859.1 similar to DNA polymerase III alpha chain [Aromatoleum aromaticum EbN1]
MDSAPPSPSPSPAPAYAELHCLTNFSFQRGASHPEELVARAAEAGYTALAITDECSLAGVVRAHQQLRRLARPLKLLIGSELRLVDGLRVVLLATDRAAYGRLARLITIGRRAATKGRYQLTCADLDRGIPGCLALVVPPDDRILDAAALVADARWVGERFPDAAWLAVELACGPDDGRRLEALLAIASAAGLPPVAATGALMHDPSRRALADVLAALRLRVTIAEAGRALAPNAERALHERAVLARRYPAELLAETLRIVARCHFRLDELRYEYPAELVPDGETPASWLRRLVEDGLRWRHGRPQDDLAPPKVRAQVEHELALIAELGFEAYFLTVEDLVRFARGRGILCQGRGSAANSVICWALGITEVDPELGIMLVERFISKERDEPPDIDVDFEHERREEVIQYVYRKYGRERAALAATVIRYRARSALRDVGRALGLPPGQLERLARDRFWFDAGRIRPERLREAGFDPASPGVQRLATLTEALVGFPRHLSQHVGGFVIARGRLDELVPVENAAMPERTVIQWDKDDLDALGLLKIDVLALGMLSALRRSLALVSTWRGRPFTLADIPREAPEVYRMLSEADSIGVFQIESRAQMTMLPRLKPARFYDLVVQVAIVRPGPIQGGMVHPYLQARARIERDEPVSYPQPHCPDADADGTCVPRPDDVRRVLERTLGVPIFQEQVMQLAVVAAGFTPGEADQLRRAMGAFRRHGELERYRAKLLAGMAARGYRAEFAERLCDQIEGFGSYGFPESHAASFALLVYCSAWLKCCEPAAFLCGLLNSQPMGFYAPSQLIQDARRHGVVVLGAEVTASDWDCTLEALPDASPGAAPAVRLGLQLVKGFGREAAMRIVAARTERPFPNVDELALRARLDAAALKRLAEAGALEPLAGHRRQALWQAAAGHAPEGVLRGARIAEPRAELAAPSEAQELVADYARLGFTLGRHPLALLRAKLTTLRFVTAAEIRDYPDRKLARIAGLVTCRQRPGTAKGTLFLTVEDETGLANVIVQAELVERQRREVLGARLLGVFGQIRSKGQVVHLLAQRLVDHSALLGALEARSRDFQ